MQIITAKPLIDQFRTDTFEESEVGPYFIAYVMLNTVSLLLTFGKSNLWDIAAGVASIVITILGVLHLKRQNRDSFGRQFLAKYFSLGWVVSVRILFIGIPAVVVLSVLTSIVGGHDALAPMEALAKIALEILFFWWLGLLIAQSNHTKSEPVGDNDVENNA
jgi:hypothetical protein